MSIIHYHSLHLKSPPANTLKFASLYCISGSIIPSTPSSSSIEGGYIVQIPCSMYSLANDGPVDPQSMGNFNFVLYGVE